MSLLFHARLIACVGAVCDVSRLCVQYVTYRVCGRRVLNMDTMCATMHTMHTMCCTITLPAIPHAGSLGPQVWRWLTYNVIRNDIMKYFAEATDWSKRLTKLTPNGKFKELASLIGELKADHGLQYTYCWHALTGYWLGVDPSAPGMKKFNPVIQYGSNHFGYTPGILLVEPTMAWNPSSFEGVGIIPPTRIREFFGELHANLRDAGIDGVKCDAQAAITQMGVGYGGGPKITRSYVHAMEQVTSLHPDPSNPHPSPLAPPP
jgi:raffinose synthase